MKEIIKLEHPGFILFEGLDLTGKTRIAKEVTLRLNQEWGINVVYNHNQGLIQQDLIDDRVVRGLEGKIKCQYYLNCYLRDFLPNEVCNFKEIIQDRYIPSLIFYSLTRHNMSLEEIEPYIKNSLKPKYIFLVECDYKNRKMRAEKRPFLKIHEQKSIASEENSRQYTELYRMIISKFGVPYTIIDTSSIEETISIKECIDHIINRELLACNISIEDLFVDFESRVYSSTSEVKIKELQNGKKHMPIKVIRWVQSDGKFVDIIEDGRHRVYATWKAGLNSIPAFVNYKHEDKIDFSRLVGVSKFTFKT